MYPRGNVTLENIRRIYEIRNDFRTIDENLDKL